MGHALSFNSGVYLACHFNDLAVVTFLPPLRSTAKSMREPLLSLRPIATSSCGLNKNHPWSDSANKTTLTLELFILPTSESQQP